MPRSRVLLVMTSLATLCTARSARADDIWMSALLQGRKIGYMHQVRSVAGDRVTTDETLDVTLARAGISITLETRERSVETRAGVALGFSSHTSMLGSDSSIQARRLPDGRFEVTRSEGGMSRKQIIDWPSGAKLAEGQRLATLAAGNARGARYHVLAFDPSAVQAMRVDGEVLGDERIDLPGGAMTLNHTRDTLEMPGGGGIVMDSWSNAKGNVHKMMMPMLGTSLELIACDRACATAPDQAVDLLTSTVVESPRALSPGERARTLDYTIAVAGDPQRPFASTDEQHPRALGGGHWEVSIGAAAPNKSAEAPEAPPTAADTSANTWLQSNAPAIRALALKTAGTLRGADARMRALQDFVRGYISEKDLSVGYASALETLKSREGDCTEHAVLLAALARALGIPARIEVGFAYAPGFAGHAQSFVPHMWVQAWTGDRWRSYDAALGRFDAGHIALGVGDGDPWRFYAGLNTLGRMKIIAVR